MITRPLRPSHRAVDRSSAGRTDPEAGDTLIEVIIAVVVIALGVVALVGALTESITSSATYRNIATLDTLLKSAADAVKDEVQLQPAATSMYQNCASPSTYPVASTYPNYKVQISAIEYWDGSTTPPGFDTSCNANDDTGIQMITLVATAPDNVTDSLSFVVTSPGFEPGISVSGSVTGSGQLTFVATLTGSVGGQSPSGAVAWTFTGSPAPTCSGASTLHPTSSTTSSASTTCTVSAAGTYQVAATYEPQSGSLDHLYDSTTGYGSATIGSAPTFYVNAPPNSPPYSGTSLSFTAVVIGSGGVVPGGSVSWISSNPADMTCTSPNLSTSGPNTAATSTDCTVTATGYYQVIARYSGDGNYLPETAPSGAVDVTSLS
jgi:Tfp pilus assembly protein PilV